MPPMPLQRREIAIIAGGVLTSALSWLAVRPWDMAGWMIGAPFGRDFVNFWIGPRLVAAGQGALLADIPAYNAAIKAAFVMTAEPNQLFVYPPHALLLFAPFAVLPFLPAVLVWTAVNLAALAFTTKLILRERFGVGMALAVCLSPPSVAMMMYGHFGGLLALATTVALLEARHRPVLAGLCLALLSTKPQFACAVGLMLLASGHWRCLVVGTAASLSAIALSAALFGLDPWQRFVSITMPMESAFVTNFDAGMIHSSVTAYFSARFAGVPAGWAWAIQGVVAAASLFLGAAALRRGGREPGALAIVLLGAMVMQPYVSHYDLAIAAPAIAPLIFGVAPGATPTTVAAWLLTPMARILFVFDLPVLGILVPAALFTQAARLFRPGHARMPAHPAIDVAA